MRTPKVHRKRRAAVLAWTAVSLTTLFGMAALSIDMGYLYTVKADLQNATDAAALAATITMFDENGLNEEAAKTTALRVVARNLDVPPQVADDIMDFTIGRFDDPFNHDQNFIPLADDDSNAVRIVLHRTAERGQPVRLFFSAAIGRHEADVSAFAIAGKTPLESAPVVPIGLRGPDFGPVDPNVSDNNPGKDGPSYPLNGKGFDFGEKVTVFIFGKGPMPPIHLTLDLPQFNGVAQTNAVLSGRREPILLSIGDRVPIWNNGTGNGNFGVKLLERMNDGNEANDTVVVTILGILSNSRDNAGVLDGDVEILDFAAVHLDEVAELSFQDPDDPDATVTVNAIVGTIVPVLVHGVATSESEEIGNSVYMAMLLR